MDLGRLERELQSAIATEFEKVTQDSTDSSENGVSDSVPIPTEDEDEIKKLTEVFEEAESTRSGSDAPENTQRSSNAEDDVETHEEGPSDHEENGGVVSEPKLLRMLARPMLGLSPTMRIIVNITAITLALWVPIIWLVVLGGGLSSPDPATLDGPTSNTPDEMIVEPVQRGEVAPEDG